MRRTCHVLLVIALATLGALPARAQSGIRLENAWARRAPVAGGHGGGTANGAVYVTIRNEGGQADALVAAASDAAHLVEFHETVHDAGVMRMRPLSKLEVGPGGAVEMKPGGHHIMLLGLTRDLKPGDKVKLTLTFDRAGQLTVEAPVR